MVDFRSFARLRFLSLILGYTIETRAETDTETEPQIKAEA